MTRFLQNALCSTVALVALSASADEAQVNTPPRINAFQCWSGDKMFRVAEREGYHVGAEARSETSGSSGAWIYFLFDKQGWGIINSFIDPDTKEPRQCNLGGSDTWHHIEPKTLTATYDARPLNKSAKICRPLAELLDRMEDVFFEVPVIRSPNGNLPDSDLMLTASANGRWSILTIDKRSETEVACFSQWGSGFLVKDAVVMHAMK